MADHLNDAAPAMKHAAKRRVQRVAWDLVLGVVAAALVTTVCADAVNAAPPSSSSASMAQAAAVPEVSISNFTFQPALLVVKVGTKVTWTNRDSTPHTVTSSDKRFVSSSGLDTNDQYSYVFDRPGTYEYFCSLHPMMVGKVVVQSAR